jgi:GT2 family glycosyltransferase
MVVWLAISSFRNDEGVVRILEQVHGCGRRIFERILVVDSKGTGLIPSLIEDMGWDDVIYRSYERNLGSGANLRERLRIASEEGADYAYALNHDGDFHPETFSKLLKTAVSLPNLGAAYPLSYLSSVGAYNLTGTRELPLPAKLVKKPPTKDVIEVFWSSSNGALYSMEPVRKGIMPWASMWMGWEDLEYGWRLSSHGFRQVVVNDAVYRDNYEYRKVWFGKMVNKPAWRTYYNARNLFLAIRRSRNRVLYYGAAAYRMFLECAVIVLARDSKWKRTKFLFMGVMDGLRTAINE